MNFSQTVQDRINSLSRDAGGETFTKSARGDRTAAIEHLGAILKEILARVEALEASARARK